MPVCSRRSRQSLKRLHRPTPRLQRHASRKRAEWQRQLTGSWANLSNAKRAMGHHLSPRLHHQRQGARTGRLGRERPFQRVTARAHPAPNPKRLRCDAKRRGCLKQQASEPLERLRALTILNAGAERSPSRSRAPGTNSPRVSASARWRA